MDFSSFDIRAKAEAGRSLRLCDPMTGKPLGTDDDHPAFLIRGFAAPSSQARLNGMLAERRKADGAEEDVDPLTLGYEGAHRTMIDNALSYIISASGMELDGKPVKTEAQIRKVLDMSFPQWSRDEDGGLKITNYPFAKQVTDAAEDQAGFFEEAGTA